MTSNLLTAPPATWPLRTACAGEREWTAAGALLEYAAQQPGPVREHLLEALNLLLRSAEAQALPKPVLLEIIHLVDFLDERREEADLAANPARRAGVERAAVRFAPKAQASISPLPLPPG